MTENLQADGVQSRQAGFVRCCLIYSTKEVISMLLSGKTVVLGVSGSIAAYKIPTLARLLKKQGCNVQVLMTQNDRLT